MSIKIQIKNRWTTNVLFELEAEDNTIAMTLKAAIKYGADLYGANLTGADLTGADLYGANLTRANLTGADLTRADLYGANLTRANLTGADLTRANLAGADLYGANLTRADLTRADLTRADLYGANLTRANLTGADLTGADLTRADLTRAKNAELVHAQTLIVGEGSLIGWKKCRAGLIVKLRIPEDAKRSNATGRKCRAEFADVLEIIDTTDKRKKPTKAISYYDKDFVYRVGERVAPTNKWSDDRFDKCAPGIHFFITRLEAENYN